MNKLYSHTGPFCKAGPVGGRTCWLQAGHDGKHMAPVTDKMDASWWCNCGFAPCPHRPQFISGIGWNTGPRQDGAYA